MNLINFNWTKVTFSLQMEIITDNLNKKKTNTQEMNCNVIYLETKTNVTFIIC